MKLRRTRRTYLRRSRRRGHRPCAQGGTAAVGAGRHLDADGQRRLQRLDVGDDGDHPPVARGARRGRRSRGRGRRRRASRSPRRRTARRTRPRWRRRCCRPRRRARAPAPATLGTARLPTTSSLAAAGRCDCRARRDRGRPGDRRARRRRCAPAGSGPPTSGRGARWQPRRPARARWRAPRTPTRSDPGPGRCTCAPPSRSIRGRPADRRGRPRRERRRRARRRLARGRGACAAPRRARGRHGRAAPQPARRGRSAEAGRREGRRPRGRGGGRRSRCRRRASRARRGAGAPRARAPARQRALRRPSPCPMRRARR